MSEIKLNQEMISALQKCKDAKAIMALAKSKGIEISGEQAEKVFAMLQNDKLSDDDLEKVTGGNCTKIVCPCHGMDYMWHDHPQGIPGD